MIASPKIADLAALRSLISQRAPGLPTAPPDRIRNERAQ